MIIFYKNLFKFFVLFSLIVGQELKDIDTKLSNLEFEQVQLPLEQLHIKYPENSDILLRPLTRALAEAPLPTSALIEILGGYSDL